MILQVYQVRSYYRDPITLSEDEQGVSFITERKRKVSRFHETILSFGELIGSQGIAKKNNNWAPSRERIFISHLGKRIIREFGTRYVTISRRVAIARGFKYVKKFNHCMRCMPSSHCMRCMPLSLHFLPGPFEGYLNNKVRWVPPYRGGSQPN